MRLLGLQKPKKDKIQPLSENMAIEMGGDIMGEIIIYSIASLTVYLEYYRQTHSKAAQESSQDFRLSTLEDSVKDLVISVDQQRAEILSLTRQLHDSHSKLESQTNKFAKINEKPKSNQYVDPRLATVVFGVVAGAIYYFLGN